MLLVPYFHFYFKNNNKILANKQYTIPCCFEKNSHPECYPIQLGFDDPKFRGFINCIEYSRTIVAKRTIDCALGPREQANQATSFLDGSTIYGSTKERIKKLRSFQNGEFLKEKRKLILDF